MVTLLLLAASDAMHIRLHGRPSPQASMPMRRGAALRAGVAAAAAAVVTFSSAPAFADRSVPPPIAILEAALGDTEKQAADRAVAAKEAAKAKSDAADAKEERLAATKAAREKAKEDYLAAKAAK